MNVIYKILDKEIKIFYSINEIFKTLIAEHVNILLVIEYGLNKTIVEFFSDFRDWYIRS